MKKNLSFVIAASEPQSYKSAKIKRLWLGGRNDRVYRRVVKDFIFKLFCGKGKRKMKGIRFIVNTGVIADNIRHLKTKYSGYKCYMAVLKGNAYGHGLSQQVVDAAVNGGADYLVACYLGDALKIRKFAPNMPVLCLNPATENELDICRKNNIAVAVADPKPLDYSGLKVHIKLDTGLGRYGLKDKESVSSAYKMLRVSGAEIDGIFTHLVSEDDTDSMNAQLKVFLEMTSDIDLKTIPIVHIPSGEALTVLDRPEFVNGTRMGSVIYGLNEPQVGTKSALKAVTNVMSVREIKAGETIGYRGNYVAKEDGFVGMLPIGYDIGFLRGYKNHTVFVNGEERHIVGSVFMCQTYCEVNEDTKAGDEVVLFRGFEDFAALAKAVNTIPEEIVLALKPSEIVYI